MLIVSHRYLFTTHLLIVIQYSPWRLLYLLESERKLSKDLIYSQHNPGYEDGWILGHGLQPPYVHPPPPPQLTHTNFVLAMSKDWKEMVTAKRDKVYILTAYMGITPNLSKIVVCPTLGRRHQHVAQCCANIQPLFRFTNSLLRFSLDSYKCW